MPPLAQRAMKLWRAWALALLAYSGCASPTLPLPPPAALASAVDAASGKARIRGRVLERAYVSCINERLEAGVLVRADDGGNFELFIEAQSGDRLQLWQTIDGDQSELVEVLC